MKLQINIILSVLFLISFILYFLFPQDRLCLTYLPSFTVAMLQILITINIVDALLDVDRKKKQEKYKKIAYQKIAPAIRGLSEMLLQMIKASLDKNYSKPIPQSYQELFNEKFLKELNNFDFKMGKAPVFPEKNWPDYLNQKINKNLEIIDNTITTYVEFLDPSIIEKLYKIQNQLIFIIIKNYDAILMAHRSLDVEWNNYLLIAGQEKYTKELADILLDTIDEINKYDQKIKFNVGYFSNNVAPKFGESRYIQP